MTKEGSWILLVCTCGLTLALVIFRPTGLIISLLAVGAGMYLFDENILFGYIFIITITILGLFLTLLFLIRKTGSKNHKN